MTGFFCLAALHGFASVLSCYGVNYTTVFGGVSTPRTTIYGLTLSLSRGFLWPNRFPHRINMLQEASTGVIR
jgi:hypothetical protein